MSKKTVDDILAAKPQWSQELEKLRGILLSLPLEETVKWNMPVYTAQGQNIVGLAGFKNHFGLWFFQGALLIDKDNILVNAQEGKTKAMRHWRMEKSADIKPTKIKAYVKEAITNAASGKAVKPARRSELVLPEQLKTALAKNKSASAGFAALSPGKQREYADYIDEAKQPATKARRMEKILPMIAAGAGLNDKYK